MTTIAILLPHLSGGGAERVKLELAREFACAGHQLEFVLVRAQGELIREAQASFPVHDLGCGRIRRVPAALARYLRTCKPDALVAAMWPLPAITLRNIICHFQFH